MTEAYNRAIEVLESYNSLYNYNFVSKVTILYEKHYEKAEELHNVCIDMPTNYSIKLIHEMFSK